MLRDAILQVDIPASSAVDGMMSYRPELFRESSRRADAAAKRWGADYLRITNVKFGLHPVFEKFRVFGSEFDCYERVLYLDSDVLVKNTAASPFERHDSGFWALPEHKWYVEGGAVGEQTFEGPLPFLLYWMRLFDADARSITSNAWVDEHYFNSGVWLVDSASRSALRDQFERYVVPHVMHDQSALNRLLRDSGVPVRALEPYYNLLVTSFSKTETLARAIYSSGFVHFAGDTKSLTSYVSIDDGVEAIVSGIQRWRTGNECAPRWRV